MAKNNQNTKTYNCDNLIKYDMNKNPHCQRKTENVKKQKIIMTDNSLPVLESSQKALPDNH